MEAIKPLKLEAIEFESVPTDSQVEEALGATEEFFNRIAGAMLATGRYKVRDPKIGALLNAAVQIANCQGQFRGQSNIAVPQPHLVQGR